MTQPSDNEPGLALTKHHGLGNDFLIAVNPGRPVDDDEVRLLCHRRIGLGADGLITAAGPDADGRWSMVLRNADGSRAEISGNGIRCLAQAIARHLDLDPGLAHRLDIETDAGRRTLDLYPVPDDQPSTMTVRVDMGAVSPGPEPSEAWSRVGVALKEQAGADIGNPHLVGFVDRVDDYDIAAVGAAVEADYATGCNVHLVEVVDTATVRQLVWERGSGVTMACGSGACAAAWAAHRLGYVDDTVQVVMPGGSVTVELVDDGALLTGPTTYVAEVRV